MEPPPDADEPMEDAAADRPPAPPPEVAFALGFGGTPVAAHFPPLSLAPVRLPTPNALVVVSERLGAVAPGELLGGGSTTAFLAR